MSAESRVFVDHYRRYIDSLTGLPGGRRRVVDAGVAVEPCDAVHDVGGARQQLPASTPLARFWAERGHDLSRQEAALKAMRKRQAEMARAVGTSQREWLEAVRRRDEVIRKQTHLLLLNHERDTARRHYARTMAADRLAKASVSSSSSASSVEESPVEESSVEESSAESSPERPELREHERRVLVAMQRQQQLMSTMGKRLEEQVAYIRQLEGEVHQLKGALRVRESEHAVRDHRSAAHVEELHESSSSLAFENQQLRRQYIDTTNQLRACKAKAESLETRLSVRDEQLREIEAHRRRLEVRMAEVTHEHSLRELEHSREHAEAQEALRSQVEALKQRLAQHQPEDLQGKMQLSVSPPPGEQVLEGEPRDLMLQLRGLLRVLADVANMGDDDGPDARVKTLLEFEEHASVHASSSSDQPRLLTELKAAVADARRLRQAALNGMASAISSDCHVS